MKTFEQFLLNEGVNDKEISLLKESLETKWTPELEYKVDIVNTVKTVVRSLSIVANWLLIVVFWIAIFSPLWIGGIALGWFLWKRFRRFKQ